MLTSFALSLLLSGPAPAPAGVVAGPGDLLQREVQDLEARTAGHPADGAAWKRLAVAYRRLARLTGKPAFDDKAGTALASALTRDPHDYEALALKGWVEAARHDFEAAVVSAQAAIALRPRDSWNYGVLADALTELGRYEEAVQAVEQMMGLRPGLAAYARAANLRGLHGDREGAIELMRMAVDAASGSDPEGLAWCLVMLGREHQARGEHGISGRHYRRALSLVPDYPLALFHLAESQAAAGAVDEAIGHLERLEATAPSAATAAALGDLHAAAGRADIAEALYRRVDEVAAAKDPSRAEPRWLARFYADQGRNLEQAIAMVRAELVTHQDIETWDGLAWALHRAGRHAEALEASEKALALGSKGSRLLLHRGLIDLALGRAEEGRARLEEALALGDLWPAERARAQAALGPLRTVER